MSKVAKFAKKILLSQTFFEEGFEVSPRYKGNQLSDEMFT